MAVTYSDISGAEPSTVTFKVETVVIDRNSTNVHREILVLGSPQTSNALAAVVASAPVSTEFGAVVRIASGPSTLADLSVRAVLSSTLADNRVVTYQSTAADLQATVTPVANSAWTVRSSAANALVTVYQSTAADFNVTVAGYSTTVNVSTGSVRVHQSSAADFTAFVNLRDGSSNVLESSTSAASTGARGLLVRDVLPGIDTFAVSTAFNNSTSCVIKSSNAAERGYVVAYSITTTLAASVQLGFYSGATLLWPLVLQAISSAISGANLAVPAPAYLFRGTTGAALTLNVLGSGTTNAGMLVGVSYYTST